MHVIFHVQFTATWFWCESIMWNSCKSTICTNFMSSQSDVTLPQFRWQSHQIQVKIFCLCLVLGFAISQWGWSQRSRDKPDTKLIFLVWYVGIMEISKLGHSKLISSSNNMKHNWVSASNVTSFIKQQQDL